jgi:hypothetical protein
MTPVGKLTAPKTNAVISHLKLKENTDYFKNIEIGKSNFNRFSQKAIQKIKEELPKLDIDKIWEANKPKKGKNKSGKSTN